MPPPNLWEGWGASPPTVSRWFLGRQGAGTQQICDFWADSCKSKILDLGVGDELALLRAAGPRGRCRARKLAPSPVAQPSIAPNPLALNGWGPSMAANFANLYSLGPSMAPNFINLHGLGSSMAPNHINSQGLGGPGRLRCCSSCVPLWSRVFRQGRRVPYRCCLGQGVLGQDLAFIIYSRLRNNAFRAGSRSSGRTPAGF